jgi:two-component system, cell cycle response regulator
MRVLVVEEDRVTALILCQTLEKLGHDVSVARNGEEAWSLYCADPYPIIITEWVLGGLTGTDLCRKIRSLNAEIYSYIVLLTSKGSRDERLEALQSGADDFLLKPLDAAELSVRMQIAGRLMAMQEEIQNKAEELVRKENAVQETMTLMTVANQRFTELFDGMPAACFSLDHQGSIHAWNRAATEMFGYEPSEVLGRTIWDVFNSKERRKKQPNDLFSRGMLEHIFAGESINGTEVELLRKDGQKLNVICNILPTVSPVGGINGAIAAHIDITERKILQRQVEDQVRVQQDLIKQLETANGRLEELAVTDGLTGLFNHRYFREQLDKNFLLARRIGKPLSIVMLDVDHFKQFNDTFGHPMGDEVLRDVAAVVKGSVRSHDIASRYGGEEFVILCPGTDAEGALSLAERIRSRIEAHDSKLRSVTASVGVSTTGPLTQRGSALLDQADKALYVSKQQGRNQVNHFASLANITVTPVAA